MRIDVRRIAQIARIDLDPQDEEAMARELELILARMDKLLELDVEGVPPTLLWVKVPWSRLRTCPMRASAGNCMECAPSVHDGYFKVPRESKAFRQKRCVAMELWDMPVKDILEHISSGEISATEVLEHYLHAIRRRTPS